MPTSVTSSSPVTMSRFQGPIPLHHNQFAKQPVTRGSLLFPPDMDYDGRKLRRTAMRKTVDYNAAIVRFLENRIWQKDYRDGEIMQPDVLYTPYMMPPIGYENNYTNAVTTRFVKAASNKVRCPIFCVAWTPEGRRLITGTSSGEFTLWNGLTFNFETILQAHDSPVRSMVWSHNDCWMVTGDHMGFIKYWQSNMNNVKMFQAHREPVRGVSFSPNDSKFTTCSDDGTVRIWDFIKCEEERVLRGHGADVKCVDWHPYKSLVASGSKDSQQPVKLWDPRSGKSFGTLHAHKSTVMDIKWNRNGNWLMTASRDHMLKLFDIRNFTSELQIFRGHKKEASVLAWHPQHEGLICSGGTDGSILFWHVGTDREVAAIEQAHDSIVWALAWHPVGHILCSGSNDHSSKYWSRNLPGDSMRDKYNLNINPYGGLMSFEERNPDGYIPGMGPEDKVDVDKLLQKSIPGLDNLINDDKVKIIRKIPYAKPIPKEFQAAWNDNRRPDAIRPANPVPVHKEFLQKLLLYAPGVKYVHEIKPDALFMYNRMVPILPNGDLEKAAKGGEDNLIYFIKSGRVPELNPLLPYNDSLPTFCPEDEAMAVDEDTTIYNDQRRNYHPDFQARSSSMILTTANSSSVTDLDFRTNFTGETPVSSQNYYPHHEDHDDNSSNRQSTIGGRQALLPPPPLPPLPSSDILDYQEIESDGPPVKIQRQSSFQNNNNSNNNNSRFSHSIERDHYDSETGDNRKFNHQFNGTFKPQPYRDGGTSNFEQHRDEISMGYDDEEDFDVDDHGYNNNKANDYENDWRDEENDYYHSDNFEDEYAEEDYYGDRPSYYGSRGRFQSSGWRNNRGSSRPPRRGGVIGRGRPPPPNDRRDHYYHHSIDGGGPSRGGQDYGSRNVPNRGVPYSRGDLRRPPFPQRGNNGGRDFYHDRRDNKRSRPNFRGVMR